MKKRILFVIPNIINGGIKSSFLNLINEISHENVDIDLLSFDDSGISDLPSFVNCLPSNVFLRMISQEQKKANEKSRLFGLFRLFCGAWVKIFGQKYLFKLLFLSYKKLSGYDVAISFSQSPNRSLSGGYNEFVLYRVCADQKVTFLHCDYKSVGINTPYSKYIYKRFDKIAAVSNGVKDVFLSECPFLRDKTYVVHNCHRISNIRNLSLEDTVEYNKDVVNFVTVARIAMEKGHIRMLDVLDRLKKEGKNFCWHIVGGGKEPIVSELKAKIESLGLDRCVKMYGDQKNPYRFLRNADFLLLPSFHEAAPMVYGEAIILGIPVVTTNTISAMEFIGESGFGMVCNNDSEGLYNAIKEILDNPKKLDKYKTSINQISFTNAIAKKEFFDMLNTDINEKWGDNNY